MNEVERYLKRATRGLWGSKRLEVREELTTHIEGRVKAHLIAGLDEHTALKRTLEELGQPQHVNTPMVILHTLPAALGLGTLTLGFCLSLVLLVSQTSAQTLDSSFSWPSPICLEGKEKETCISNEPWFSLAALKDVLEPQGVTIDENTRRVSFSFPGSIRPVTLPVRSAIILADENGEPYPKNYQPLTGFYRLSHFLSELAQGLTVPMQVSGWQQLTVEIADVVFEVDMRGSGSQRWSFDRDPGYYFYSDYLLDVVASVAIPYLEEGSTRFAIQPINSRDKNSARKRLRLMNFNEGVYGVVSRTASTLDTGDTDYSFALDVAQSDSNGTLKLRLPKSHEGFVSDLEGLSVGNSVLVRLTGEIRADKFGYEVIPPGQITLE